LLGDVYLINLLESCMKVKFQAPQLWEAIESREARIAAAEAAAQ
jgi:hypothetical protein